MCVCIYIYIYKYTHTHIHTLWPLVCERTIPTERYIYIWKIAKGELFLADCIKSMNNMPLYIDSLIYYVALSEI
jgi:hypothetical protein